MSTANITNCKPFLYLSGFNFEIQQIIHFCIVSNFHVLNNDSDKIAMIELLQSERMPQIEL